MRTIHVTKKLGAPTKHLEVCVCYGFHFGISNEEEDFMFATKLGLFSIGTIIVLTLVWSNQLVKFITLAGMNIVEVIVLVEPMFESHVLSNILVKPVFVLLVKIVIPLDTFQQHLPKMFFQLEAGEMEMDKTPTQIKVQNLHIAGWIITK